LTPLPTCLPCCVAVVLHALTVPEFTAALVPLSPLPFVSLLAAADASPTPRLRREPSSTRGLTPIGPFNSHHRAPLGLYCPHQSAWPADEVNGLPFNPPHRHRITVSYQSSCAPQIFLRRLCLFPSPLLLPVVWGSLFCSHLAAVCPAAMAAAIRVVIEAYLTAIQRRVPAPVDLASSTSFELEQSTAAYLIELFGMFVRISLSLSPPRTSVKAQGICSVAEHKYTVIYS